MAVILGAQALEGVLSMRDAIDGGKTYSKPQADRALALSIDFFRTHLGR